MTPAESQDTTPPAQRITDYIAALADWRGPLLARLRTLILATEPALVEAWKWDTPVWMSHGNVVAAATFQDHIKLNFFKGASLQDPHSLFNAGLEAKATRAIDIHDGDTINEAALQDLIRAAVAENTRNQKPAKH
ncbi:MAG: DUF1801 domain-containing protein [Herpetosiphon sp.]